MKIEVCLKLIISHGTYHEVNVRTNGEKPGERSHVSLDISEGKNVKI
jgi:hypothetical protein